MRGQVAVRRRAVTVEPGRQIDHRWRARGPVHAVNASRKPSQVKSLAADIERSLSIAGTSTAEAVTSGAREAQNTLVAASSEAANHVKSLAIDVERTLTAVGADTAASILASAREAQTSLTATSADAASQIKAIAADIERSLGVVTASTTDNHPDQRAERTERAGGHIERSQLKVKSTSAEVERSVLRRQQQFRLDDDRQDRRNRHLCSAADRSSGADRR
jgi:hypothetical protein